MHDSARFFLAKLKFHRKQNSSLYLKLIRPLFSDPLVKRLIQQVKYMVDHIPGKNVSSSAIMDITK